MAVAGEQILTRLGFEVDEISLKSSLEKVAAFGSALRRPSPTRPPRSSGSPRGRPRSPRRRTRSAFPWSGSRNGGSSRNRRRFGGTRSKPPSRPCSPTIRVCPTRPRNWSARAGRCGRWAMPSARRMRGGWASILPSSPCSRRTFPGCATCSRSLYATAGTDAAQAAEDSKGFLDGMARLAGLCDLLAKTVALSLLGTARSGIEALGDAFVAHFDDIRRVLELVVALASAAAPVIGAALGLLVSWGGQLAGLLGTLDADLVAGSARDRGLHGPARGRGRGDHRVRQPQGSVGAADGGLFRQPLPPRHRSRRDARGGRHGQLGRGQGVPPRRLGRRGVRRAGRRGCGGVGLQ